MPQVTATPRTMQDGQRITRFIDSVGPAYVTWTYPTEQESFKITNQGLQPIVYSVGSYTDITVQPGQSSEQTVNFTTIQVKSTSGVQAFEVRTDESGNTFDQPGIKGLSEQVGILSGSIDGYKTTITDANKLLAQREKEISELVRLLYLGSFVAKDDLFLWLDGADFTNSPQTTTWNDRSGKGYNMTMNNFTYDGTSGSDGAGGVVFDGVDNFGRINDNPDIRLTGKWTLELHLKINNALANKFILGKGAGTNGLDYSLLFGWVSGNYELFSNDVGTLRSGTATGNIGDSNYHLVTYTYDGSFVRVYLDGALVAKTLKTFTMATSADPFILGNTMIGESNFSAFTIKSLKMYSRALTDFEVSHNYAIETGKQAKKSTLYTFENVVNGANTVIYLPKTYNDLVKNKYMIFVHGAGGYATDIANVNQTGDLLAKLLDDGFVVIGTTGVVQNSWGNQQSSIDIQDLVNYYTTRYNLADKPYVLMQSMGGLVTMNSITRGYLQPKAIAGVFPVLNLKHMYDNTGFKSAINTAYGITDASQYSTKTSGSDPMLSDTSTYKSVPFYILASYGDTIVSTAQNRDLFKQKLLAAGGDITTVDTVGDHGDLSNYQSDNIINFFNSR